MQIIFSLLLLLGLLLIQADKLGDINSDVPALHEPTDLMQVVHCTEYYVMEEGDSLERLQRSFELDDTTFKLLNPMNLEPLHRGSVLCVSGSVLSAADGTYGKEYGKHTARSTYVMTPGNDTCANVLERTQPRVSLTTFVALNPQISCDMLASVGGEIFLPRGTTVRSIPSTPIHEAGICAPGPWGNWTECTDGHTSRFRNVYQLNSAPCPEISDEETKECGETPHNLTSQHKERQMTEQGVNQCPIPWYDGCSVPHWMQLYHLFVPACNVHDICYGCSGNWKYREHVSGGKWQCDIYFKHLMDNLCGWRWGEWWQHFDRQYCFNMATIYAGAVLVMGRPSEPRWEDFAWYQNWGCEYLPWDWRLNNAANQDSWNKGFDPNRPLRNGVKCPCGDGTSCQFW